MGCNCKEGNIYQIGFGCCRPSIIPADDFYTKHQIDEMLEDIESSGITEEEVDEKIASAKTEIEGEIPSLDGYATEQWVLDKHYISGVDLSDYALKSEIPTVPTSNTAFTNDAGYLTQHQSLSGYVTDSDLSAYTYDKATIDEKVASGGSFDPTNYYNKTEVDNKLSGKTDNSSFSAHTADTTVHVTQSDKNAWNAKVDSSTLNNYLLKSKIWCGTQQQYDSIQNKDNETLYLIHA